jgi:hypothetical protein
MSWMLAGAALSAGSSILGGIFGADAAREEARLAWEQTLEDARRLEYDQKKNYEDAVYQREDYKTTLAASGVRNSGTAMYSLQSADDQILELKQEQGKELAYLLKAGSERANQIKDQGKTAFYSGVLGAASAGVTGWANR